MPIADRGVEFSFNNLKHKQIGGLAMDCYYFFRLNEQILFDHGEKPAVHLRCVDDTCVIFESERDCDLFHENLSRLHPALNFTIEKEQNNSLSFLDFLVEK